MSLPIRTLRRRAIQQELRESARASLVIRELLAEAEALLLRRRRRNAPETRYQRKWLRSPELLRGDEPVEKLYQPKRTEQKETPEEMAAWRAALAGPKKP